MSALTLKVKSQPLSLQLKPTTLKEAAKLNPALLDEVDKIIASARQEERLYLIEEMKQNGDMEGALGITADPHYNFYKSLQTPSNPVIQNEFIYGIPKSEVKESIKNMKLTEVQHLKNLYESFQGGDSTYPSATSAGVVLRKRQNESELRLVQLIVNSRFNADPYARSIIQTFSRYIFGSGVRANIENPLIQDLVDTFFQKTSFSDVIKDYGETSFKDGEVGLSMQSKIVKKGGKNIKVDWRLKKVFSEEIRGFEYDIEDPGTKYTYFKQYAVIEDGNYRPIERWIADVDYFYQLNSRGNIAVSFGSVSKQVSLTKNEVMLWFSHGDKRELRGRVPLEPILRDLRLYEDFRINRAIINYERSKVLYIRQGKSGLTKKGDYTIKKSSSPKGGVELSLPPGDTYKMETANLMAQDADHDGLLFLYAAGSGVNMPVYMFAVRADQQNYGAIKNTDSPFNQMILDYSNQFSVIIKKGIRWVISRNIEAGIIEPTVKVQRVAKEKQKTWYSLMEQVTRLIVEADTVPAGTTDVLQKYLDSTMEEVEIDAIDIPIDIVIADSIKPNPLEWAKVAFIERNLGLVSSQTLAEERGRNWQVELIRILREKELGIMEVVKQPNQVGAGNDVKTGDKTNAQNSQKLLDSIDKLNTVLEALDTVNKPTK